MSKLKPKYVRLSERWMHDNRNLMGILTPLQRLLFLVVFYMMKWSCRYKTGDILYLTGDSIREYTHSLMSDKQLAKALSELRKTLEESYGEKTKEFYHEPYEYIGFKRGYFCFKLLDCDVFQPPKDTEERYITLNLTEIAAYKTGRKVNCKAIPLLWYILCSQFPRWMQQHKYGEYVPYLPAFIELDIGDMELKTIFGFTKYDYLNIPHGDEGWDTPYNRNHPKHFLTVRDFFIDFDSYLEKRDHRGFESYDVQKNAEYALTEKYNQPMWHLQAKYDELKKDTHYLRWHFEQTVLNPAIEEINKFGTMIRFTQQDRYKRSAHLTFASKIKSPYSKNYTMHDTWKNVKNFRKLESGRQYHFAIEILQGQGIQDVVDYDELVDQFVDELVDELIYDSNTGTYNPLEDNPTPAYYDNEGFPVGSIISGDEEELPFF